MKKIILSLLFYSIACSDFAQVNYCVQVQKSIVAIENNFRNYNTYAFPSVTGAKAYDTDISFVEGGKAYVYRDEAKNKIFFSQTLTADTTKYSVVYQAIDHCLFREADHWSVVDSETGKGAVFVCSKNGGRIFLVKRSYGLVIEISRDELKATPVFNASFCSDLNMLIKDAGNKFTNSTGAYVGTSVTGKQYKAKGKLNQRGVEPSIYINSSETKKGKTDYQYTELIPGTDMLSTEVISYFDKCLTASSGWKKGFDEIFEKTIYKKGAVVVSLWVMKAYSEKDPDDTLFSVETTQ
ncbi:MAG: hypothetical protein JJE22_18840 [Bacteroidia bacterium]|nr:hypothetical protein [Bacteroidia bacterium]